MSKRKLLIHEVFQKIKSKSEKDTKNGWATDLSDDIERKLGFIISVKTLSRYHDSFITGIKEETGIETLILNKLSEYLDYKDFTEFSRTFTKKDDEANKTTVKISVDKDEESLTEKLSNIIINITNEQNFKMPEFIKKNGMGIMEIVLLICFTTGTVAFSKKPNNQIQGIAGILEPQPQCMYWDRSEYKLVDCQNKNPIYNHKISFDYEKMTYLKRIERKDTLTVENAYGKVWYSKYNGVVEFFTNDGVDPNNGRELRKATEYIIDKYAGVIEEEVEQ
ncbi:hypothetical protein LNP04_10710 [Chryseobacterium sp. C-71]|uniref:hypothetical protein n=1 Tax=Chryseobacterium sp. C-71 TaxID=2893882 RepID=UPI001E4A5D62|nr:hypothetical protein [Chryseobacterium sp. C-71]UFH30451.1 hypothetical protein LNP04_10710 [Chryseobacterium sp. C-71]